MQNYDKNYAQIWHKTKCIKCIWRITIKFGSLDDLNVRNFILIQFVKKKNNFIAAKNNFKNHYYIESDTISKKNVGIT